MLKRFFKKGTRKVYLNCIAVAPRPDIKRHFDQWGLYGRDDIDSSLRSLLEEIFDLPSIREIKNPTDNDLGLDIVVPRYQSGCIGSVELGDLGFPIAWRPKLEIGSRLYSIKMGKTVYTTTVRVKMPWGEYLSRILTLRAFIRFKPIFNSEDMNRLLARACMQLTTKLKNVV